jgi:hypothetical protein
MRKREFRANLDPTLILDRRFPQDHANGNMWASLSGTHGS